jgi:hypothetical protein
LKFKTVQIDKLSNGTLKYFVVRLRIPQKNEVFKILDGWSFKVLIPPYQKLK